MTRQEILQEKKHIYLMLDSIFESFDTSRLQPKKVIQLATKEKRGKTSQKRFVSKIFGTH